MMVAESRAPELVSELAVMSPAALRSERIKVSFIDSCTVDLGTDGFGTGAIATAFNCHDQSVRYGSGSDRLQLTQRSGRESALSLLHEGLNLERDFT